jgi:PKD repeat protein
MAVKEVHVGDINVLFVITLKDNTTVVDISSATTKEIIFKKSDGTTLTKTALFSTDGTDGKVQYATISGDINMSGLWSVQAHIISSSGEWKSSVANFDVYGNI